MQAKTKNYQGLVALLFTALVTALVASCSADSKPKEMASAVFDSADIVLPADFRTTMSHLGSWFVPGGDASGFHDVYTQPETIAAFRQTGKFPDGAVLVKELRAHATGNFTTGTNVSYANDQLKQWFVMVKDTKGRFPDSPLWGDGWGWALFQPGKTGNVATNYETDCKGCHVPAQQTDWVYVDAYPTLSTPN